MLVSLSNWLKKVQSSPHLLPLIKEKKLNIYLEIEETEIVYVVIYDGVIGIVDKLDGEKDVYIYSNRESVYRLLTGEVRLRQAVSNHLIVVKGTLRNILLLESIFWLSSIPYRYTSVTS